MCMGLTHLRVVWGLFVKRTALLCPEPLGEYLRKDAGSVCQAVSYNQEGCGAENRDLSYGDTVTLVPWA